MVCSAVNNTCGTGGWSGPLPGDPDTNALLTAVPVFGGIDVSWTVALVNPHAVAHTLLYRSLAPDFDTAVRIAVVGGTFYYDKLELLDRQYYWIQIVSVNGTYGEVIGPASAIPRLSIDATIEALTSKIDAGFLAQSLKEKIDSIDIYGSDLAQEIQDRILANQLLGNAIAAAQTDANQAVSLILDEINQRAEGYASLIQAINAETTARNNAINEERTERVAALAAEALARGTAITNEATIRQYEDEALAQQITTLTGVVDDNVGAIQDTLTVLANEDAALAERISIVAATSDAVRAATAAMVLNETRARADSDTAFAQQITTLSAAVNDNAANIQTESTTRASQYNALAEQITLVSAGVGEQFDFKQIWYFDDSVDGWTGNGTPTVSAGWLRPANHATNPYVDSPSALAVTATQHNQVRLRIRKYGTPTWAGKLWWKRTSDSTWDAARSIVLNEPAYDGSGIGLISTSVSWADTIDQVRLVLSTAQDATNYFTIDWFAVGRPSPGASTAALLNEAVARSTADTALTNQLNSLSSTVTGNYGTLNAAIATEATTRANTDSALSSQINSVSATASGKNKVFVQSAVPAATQMNDLWIHTGEGNKTYRWNGSAWDEVDDVRIVQNIAAISAETTARVEGDSALAQQITTLDTKVDTNTSSLGSLIQQENESRVENEEATAKTIDRLAAVADSLRVATAAFSTVAAITKANENEAFAQRVDLLQANLETEDSNLLARIFDEETVRSTETTALANSLNVVSSKVDVNTADIATEISARTAADNALANQITTVTSAIEDNVASVQTALQTNIDTVNGKVTDIGALYTAKVQVNGLIGGFGVYNDGTEVQAGFDVDTFWVGRTNADKKKPFIIDNNTGETYIDKAVIPTLTADMIDTRGLSIKDTNGNIILAGGTALDWNRIGGAGKTTVESNASTALANAATAQTTANNAATAASNAQTSANTANNALAEIASDSKFTPSEKKITKKEWDGLVAEKAGINAQASALSITTENTAYNNAYNALNTYITPLLSSLTTTSNIVGSTFRSTFSAFYSARQALLNKIVDVASQRAVWSNVSGAGKPEDGATVGAPAGTFVAGVQAANVATAVTDFNASNNRNAAAITAPTILTDGSAVDHVAQKDGSVDISFEWSWSGNEGDIDGFLVYVRPSTSSLAYTLGTTPVEETVYTVPANKRAFVLFGVAADKHYTFGVQAYRAVDKAINATGAIKSALVKATGSGENPYLPSSTVKFTGDVTGTISGTDAATVVSNASTALTNANNARTEADKANSTLADIAADNKLTPAEKQSVRKEWDTIYAERAGIRAQADSFGITTEKTNYDNYFQALGTYLNGGTAYTIGATPPSWITDANLGTTTTIVGATFRANWSNLYANRQALLNKISAEASKRADWSSVSGKTGFAALDGKITSGNVTTYIDYAAIGAAQIGSVELVGESAFKVRTNNTTGARMDMDSRRIKIFDSNGTLRVQLGNLTV